MTELKRSRGPVVKATGSSGGTDAGRIEAVFATIGGPRDLDGDIIEPGAITQGPVILGNWNHSVWSSVPPIGRGRIKIVGNQARFVGRFFMDTAAGRDAHAVLKGLGDLAEFSWSLDNIKSRMGKDSQGRTTRFITSVDVREVSPVLQAASIGTQLLDISEKTGAAGCLTGAERDELERIKLRLIADQLRKDMTADALRKELSAIKEKAFIAYSECFRVPTGTRAAAKAAIDSYAPGLGIDPAAVTIRWFTEEPADDGPGAFGEQYADFTGHPRLGGRCQPKLRPNEMWLHADLDDLDAWSIAAHELRHLAGGDEEQAEIFEIRARLDLDRSTT